MDSIDFASLSTAPAKRLAELADYYGLEQTGQRKTWGVRKTCTNRLTGKVEALKLSMKTVDLRDALRKAIPLVEAFLTRNKSLAAPVVSVVKGRLALADLEAAYLAAPTVRANAKTRKLNWAELERIFKRVHAAVDFGSASVEMIDRELAKSWQRARLAEIEVEFSGDVVAQEAAKRGMNSTIAHAQSVFSRHAMEDFYELGLPAGVKDFAAALPVKARHQEEPEQVSDSTLEHIFGAMPAIKAKDPAVWVAFQLMIWGGLRNIDCVHARRSWLSAEGDGYRLTMKPGDEYSPKGKSGSVFLAKVIVDEMLALSAPSGAESPEITAGRFLVPAKSKTARVNAIYRDLNEELRALGVGEESNKIAYRLRKKFLALVAEQQGRAMASLAARHADSSTLDFYVAKPTMSQPITIGLQAVA